MKREDCVKKGGLWGWWLGEGGGRRTGSGCIYNYARLRGERVPVAAHLLKIPQQPPLRLGLLFDMIQIFSQQSASISGAKTCVCFAVRLFYSLAREGSEMLISSYVYSARLFP